MSSTLPFKFDGIDKQCGCTFLTEIGERRRRREQQREYTDSDLARDMQGLSFQERQRLNEDIHLVADQVKETDVFVEAKANEVTEVLNNLSKCKIKRDAWDRAVFLRPSLASDRDHYLMILRAKNYDPYDAAILLLRFYELKRVVWGEELLARRGLSFQERQRVTEDVHLVTDQVKETEEFLKTKMKELLDVIDSHTKQRVQREAWDHAVFLRPTLAEDRDHHLMFLRAKDYDTYDAAMLLFKFYETKRRLWGDGLVARRISWDDRSEDTRAVYERNYAIWRPRNKESPSRKVWYDRSSTVDLIVVDPMDYVRALLYSFFCNTFANEDVHRKSHIVICDLRGPFKMSTFQYVDICHMTLPMFESLPGRVAVVHFLVEESAMIGIVRSMQALSCRDRRLRVQIHVGSWMEIQYSLRNYGIDIAADWKEGEVEGSPFSSEYIETTNREYLQNEEEWKLNEAPYCDTSSDFALYPNSQDILMGRNRNIAPSWPGNVAYMALIHEYTAGYGIVTTKSEKTAMAKEILLRLKSELQARFLNRKDSVGWEAVTDEEARVKVSQSLRDEYRKIFKTGAF